MFKYGDVVRIKNVYGFKDDIGIIIGYNKMFNTYLVEFEGRTDLHGGNGEYDEWSKDYINDKLSSNRWWLAPHDVEIIDVNRDPYEDWLNWEDDWDEDINEEYNHDTDEFELGDEVIISDSSEWRLDGRDNIGVRIVGVIVGILSHRKNHEYKYRVQWENTHNIYRRDDLILYDKDPYDDWIQWEDDWKDVNEEHNHEIDEFRVGDKVVINDTSRFKEDGYHKNNRMIGEIIKIYNENFYSYEVKWENWVRNVYRKTDLILYDKDPYDDWIQWEDDWKDVNEEYDYENFKVGDKVILDKSKKDELQERSDFYIFNEHLFDVVGEISGLKTPNVVVLYDENITLFGVYGIILTRKYVTLPKRDYVYANEIHTGVDKYSDWIQWEDDWKDVNEEYDYENFVNNKFEVGDKVRCIELSDDDYYNIHEIGEIDTIKEINLRGLIFNKCIYTVSPYRYELVVDNPDLYQDWEEWNENILNENNTYSVGDIVNIYYWVTKEPVAVKIKNVRNVNNRKLYTVSFDLSNNLDIPNTSTINSSIFNAPDMTISEHDIINPVMKIDTPAGPSWIVNDPNLQTYQVSNDMYI